MKLSPIEVLIGLLALRSAEGFLGNAGHQHQLTRQQSARSEGGSSGFNVSPCYSLGDGSDPGETENSDVSRRGFLNGVTFSAITGLGLGLGLGGMGVQDASAVDFQVPDMGKLGSGQSKQRVGGLANKIRNSCRVMVRIVESWIE